MAKKQQKSTEKQGQSLRQTSIEKQGQSLRQTSTEKQGQSLPNDKKRLNKSLIRGSIIATLIAITPYFYSLYESVPQQRVWNTFLFTYESNLFDDANYFVWLVTGKMVPLYLLFLWFFTCKHWWYHALLVPIAMYILQTIIVFNGDFSGNPENIDEFQLIYLIPIMCIVIPTIYLIRARIFNRINTADKSMQELEDEFKLTPKNFWGKVKDYF